MGVAVRQFARYQQRADMALLTRNRVAAAMVGLSLSVGVFGVTTARVEAQAARAENARIKALLQQRAATLKSIFDRMQQMMAANAAQPQEVFQAKTAAAFAAADAADTDAQRLTILQSLLNDTVAYEKLVTDSIRANPAAATDARGRADRLNAIEQLRVSQIDLQLAIERLRAGG